MIDEETTNKIKEHYQRGQGSIQDIARVYRVSVDEVLSIIGQNDLTTVMFAGDLIDVSEAGPNAEMNYGSVNHVTYTTD